MERFKYQILVDWKKTNKKPLMLLGARQVGKTYLLKEFAEQEFKRKFHYFNFEEEPDLAKAFKHSLKPKKIVENLKLMFDLQINELDLIIFDEIQMVPEAITSLKYFAESPNYFVIAAGSLLGVSLNQASFPVGKVQTEYLYPMSFEEFLKNVHRNLYLEYKSHKCENNSELVHDKLNELYLHYLCTGGQPEIVQIYVDSKKAQKIDWQQIRAQQLQLIKNYQADFAKHSGSTNALHLAQVWSECARQLSENKDEKVRRFRFQGVLPNKKQFSQFENTFQWLEKAFLIHKSFVIEKIELPLEVGTRSSLFKAFLFDCGLLNAMVAYPIFDILEQTPTTFKGFIAENYACSQLKSLGVESLYTWNGKTSEIEFVIQCSQKIVPFEVKSGFRTRSKSLGVYSELYNPATKVILSMNPYSEKSGLYKVPLYAIEKFVTEVLKLNKSE